MTAWTDHREIFEEGKKIFQELQSRTEPLKNKDRISIPRQAMPTQEPEARSGNLCEVSIGFSQEQAVVEAMRCLDCKTEPCVAGCPVSIDIPGFIKKVSEQDFSGAAEVIKRTSLLPAICGRVCPQETQCEEVCTVGKSKKTISQSVAIGGLERFVADWEQDSDLINTPKVKAATKKKVGVIGSGPAGLVVAADVRREGHEVVLFEAFHKLGGVMRYGIPEFRLPNSVVDQEISLLKKMGVEFQLNTVVGRTRKIEDLLNKDGFDALFVGSGAGLPLFMGIPGEERVGVFAANEYLTRANLMRAYDKEHADTPIYASKKVVVLGGGNVAMDASRMALRLGAETVSVVYRRTLEEMPARREEIEHAMEEGIEFRFLENLLQIDGGEDGRVTSCKVQRYKLGEADDSGRRRPMAIEGDTFEIPVDTVIIAIGNGSNPLIKQTTPNLETNRRGNLVVDKSGKTNLEGVFAGGDIVLGAATVILAMGEGRKAASSINEMLASNP